MICTTTRYCVSAAFPKRRMRTTASDSLIGLMACAYLQTLDIGLYGTWSNLVLDENRLGAMHTINPGRECIWQWNRPGQFYLCKIDGLKWDRSQRKLRVYIDARCAGLWEFKGSSATAAAAAASVLPRKQPTDVGPETKQSARRVLYTC